MLFSTKKRFSSITYHNGDICGYLQYDMQSQRQQKYARQLQKDMGEVFQRDPRHFFGNSLVTLTSVDVSPDLGVAKLYLSVFPIKDVEDVFFRLEERKNELRKLLGNKIGKRVRIIPYLVFKHDQTQEHAAGMDRLINSLNIPPAPPEDEDNEGEED